MNGDNRALELLAQKVTEGLDAAGTMELRRRLGSDTDRELSSFAHAAAACEIAMGDLGYEMPPGLRDRAREALLAAVRTEPQSGAAPPLIHPRRAASAATARFSDRLGWLIAAAALALSIIGWWPRPGDWPLPEASRRAEPGLRRGQLLATADDAIELPWQATEDPAASGASGDLIWSLERQAGFMRFHGLEINDPTEFQYQLWIFDATRDDRYPIDGGVFDVASANDVIVPIAPRLRVGRPVLFAITVEPPDGVVVSSRERIVLLAKVS